MLLKFLVDNINLIVALVIFFVGLYVQGQSNTQKIDDVRHKCDKLDVRLDQQYQHIDEIKLDKDVFNATIEKFQSMSDDIREIRKDIKEVLKQK